MTTANTLSLEAADESAFDKEPHLLNRSAIPGEFACIARVDLISTVRLVSQPNCEFASNFAGS